MHPIRIDAAITRMQMRAGSARVPALVAAISFVTVFFVGGGDFYSYTVALAAWGSGGQQEEAGSREKSADIVAGESRAQISIRLVPETDYTQLPWHPKPWVVYGHALIEPTIKRSSLEDGRIQVRLGTSKEHGFYVTIIIPRDVGAADSSAEVIVYGYSDLAHPVYGYSSFASIENGEVAIGTRDAVPSALNFEIHGTYQGKDFCWHGYCEF